MDGEDEEFEKLLGEIPQAMDSPAQLEVLDTPTGHALPQLEGKHVPRSQSTESFQDLLQAFQPLSDRTEEHMYFPLSAGNAKRREDGLCRTTAREEGGRSPLDLCADANTSGALGAYPFQQQEEDPYRYMLNPSSSISVDNTMARALASLELLEGTPVQYNLKQAEKMGHGELVGRDATDFLVQPAALHDQAEATLGTNSTRSTSFRDEGDSKWLPDMGSFMSTAPCSLSSAQLAINPPVLHPSRQDLKSFGYNKSSGPVFFPSSESLLMDVPANRMYRQACANATDRQTLSAGSGLDFCLQGFGSQPLHKQLDNFEGPAVCRGQVDGTTNFYPSTGNGVASHAQAHRIQLLQKLREEERKHRIEQILMHAQPAGCPQNCVDSKHNNLVPSFYVDKDHGYGFPQVGGALSLDVRHHVRHQQQLVDPHSDNFCALCKQGVCHMGKDCPLLHFKARGPSRNEDFLVSPVHFEKVLHKSTSLNLPNEKPPLRILSRKGSRVAAPSSAPLMGCHFNNNNGCIHSESHECFHPPAPLWNAPSGHILDPRKFPTDAMHSGFIYSSLTDIEGRIFSVAKDQHGCRFLQRKFDEGATEDVQKIFSEIIEHAVELMVDPFGNYLIQKLLEVCTDDQRMELLESITRNGELINVSLNTHGTRAVQKLVETLNSSKQVSIATASLRSGVVMLIKDLNGNHVIQRCLQHLSNDENEFIFEAAAYNCVEIATHRHGCCVLQRCIDHSTGGSRQRLIHEIALNSLQLAQDSFGNYVVQYVLDLGLSWAKEEVMDRLVDNYARLSMQKFSSNVVEKCLQLSGEERRVRIVQELIDSSHLLQLLQDPYANYVIQSVLMVSKGALHASVVEAIRPHIPTLRSSPYGKRILSRRSFKKF